MVGEAVPEPFAAYHGQVAKWDGAHWAYFDAEPETVAFVRNGPRLLVRSDAAWIDLDRLVSRTGSLKIEAGEPGAAGLRVTGDITALQPGPSGSHRLVIDRSTPDGTALLNLQTAEQNRAELQAYGDGGLQVRTSENGTFATALSVSSSGKLTVIERDTDADLEIVTVGHALLRLRDEDDPTTISEFRTFLASRTISTDNVLMDVNVRGDATGTSKMRLFRATSTSGWAGVRTMRDNGTFAMQSYLERIRFRSAHTLRLGSSWRIRLVRRRR